MDLNQRFKKIVYGSYQRIDNDHPLDIYIGQDLDKKYVVLLITKNEPMKIISSNGIKVEINKRKDDQWAIIFKLLDTKKEQLFNNIFTDIIETSRHITSKSNGCKFMISRFDKWQRFLSKHNDLLSESEIKGLIGELFFLKNYSVPKYGEDIAIQSWLGPLKNDKDFVLENYWYEIKTIINGKNSVSISSLEQLDSKVLGELVVIKLDKTNKLDHTGLTINKLLYQLKDIITNEINYAIILDKLLDLGYVNRSEYDEYIYSIVSITQFLVDDKFPKIIKKSITQEIIKVTYELSLASIAKYEI